MSDNANNEKAGESEKPVHNDGVIFPPFPDPQDEDFDEDISEDERLYYKNKFKDLNLIKSMRLHCSACDRHMGCSARNETRMRAHPMLRTLVCHTCHTFYNSGEFEKGDDGSELYCRWCGQGGQVYCCSDCPHVFCAKCIRRNLGVPKIREIENADDWKCFKCNNKCLWDLRAICWAVLRYCDLKNKITYQTQDPEKRESYQKDCAIDHSQCCRNKSSRRSHKIEPVTNKKKEIKKETETTKSTANIISKIPPTIQVKKFASVNNEDEKVKQEKKAQKRSLSPKSKPMYVKNTVNMAPCAKVLTPISIPPLAKKIRMPSSPIISAPIRLVNANDRKSMATYTRIRPKMPQSMPIPIVNSYNGFNSGIYNNSVNDNINLSIESLTQGLDMAAVAALQQNNSQEDDVVCTPDFPLEPLCEVMEDNDDDVQCITPGPVAAPKLVNPPPLVPRTACNLSDITADNIIQMTENDVTVNAATGGLKFRVDPQTLSSNKMYRLPDGRIFAINSNPNMPGGYSATIVAVTEAAGKAAPPKGATYAAKLSAVTNSTSNKSVRVQSSNTVNSKRSIPKSTRLTRSSISGTSSRESRECDLNVPVEWYRYNLIDAVDALEYGLSRLNKLKKEATTVYLRTRNINEMRSLHRTLERLLNTASNRFGEIRENLNKGLKQYVSRKMGENVSDDDDDVEILPDMDDNDDPIFIDENSLDSHIMVNESQEVDLTGAGSSEYNDSAEKNETFNRSDNDTLNISENDNCETMEILPDLVDRNDIDIDSEGTDNKQNNSNDEPKQETALSESKNVDAEPNVNGAQEPTSDNDKLGNETDSSPKELDITGQKTKDTDVNRVNEDDKIHDSTEKTEDIDKQKQDIEEKNDVNDKSDIDKNNTQDKEANKSNGDNTNTLNNDDTSQDVDEKPQDDDDKLQDSEISEEMIESLLKDDESASNMNILETLQDT